MSRLQDIENVLQTINEAIFQELCDSFLVRKKCNYRFFSRTGSQIGKQKTIKGTPDGLMLLPSGKYLFAEYSTNTNAGISKLKDDINKCIDVKKTGIPLTQIDEIILCVNFKINTAGLEELKNVLSQTHINLTVYTLDSLAVELHLEHRDLASRYLKLPLDTGQIVSIEQFISEYNKASQGIATPLDNKFLHRDTELEQIKKLVNENDFIIISGAPGVGKTKLALETINSFLKDNMEYSAYCISYKQHTLLEDLYQYLKPEKHYILFVDDANRIDTFSQITGFYKAERTGKLKILVTVRDYAFNTINMLCNEFSPVQFEVDKFNDAQIIDIIKVEPFSISNYLYQKEIVRIADGNPRLAIMSALLALDKQNIQALADVSDLFEKYFSSFVKDKGELTNLTNIKILGVISFFFAIPYKDRETTESLINDFELDYNSFIDSINILEKLELVEIQYEYVKILEQNLSVYFFYKTFIKDNLLSFETLLYKYFDSYDKRFTDCVIPANNTFGYNNVIKKLTPSLQNYWKSINGDKEKSFKLLSVFWFYLQNEAFNFIYNHIESLPINNEITFYEVKYEINDFAYQHNEIIQLIGNFYNLHDSMVIKTAIELALEYVRKKPEHLPELIHKIRESLIFDLEDEFSDFIRQNSLFEILIDRIDKKDILYSKTFFSLSETFLSYSFLHIKSGRHYSITTHQYLLPNNTYIQSFRRRIWKAVNNHFKDYPKESFELLQSYSRPNPDVVEEIMKFDLPYLIEIIDKYLTPESFEHCKYVQEQIKWCKRHNVVDSSFSQLQHKFTNSLYEMFLKIDWNMYKDKEIYEFENHDEYEKIKETEIRESFILGDTIKVGLFLKDYIYLKNISENNFRYNNALDIIVDENCSQNFEMGCQLLNEIITCNNEIQYIPELIFRNHLTTADKAQRIWNIIQNHDFPEKSFWEMSFYCNLNDMLINRQHVNAIKNTILNFESPFVFYFFKELQKYLVIDPLLYKEILEIIVNKNSKTKDAILIYENIFYNFFDLLGDDIELIEKAYLQQTVAQQHHHFDFDKKGLLKILQKDPYFLLKYINSLYEKESTEYNLHKENSLDIIWQINNIEPVLESVFDLVDKKEVYLGISEHFCNSFFKDLPTEIKKRAIKFLFAYCKKNYSNPQKINIIINIMRHSMRDHYDDMLLFYISLNQDVACFSKILWRGNGEVYSGEAIIGDIKAEEWKNILSIIDKSPMGIKLLPIKGYINDMINCSQRQSDKERQRKYLEQY
jgi:hypothetical protein